MRLTDDNGEINFVTIAAGKFHEWNVGSTKSAISTPASQPPTAHFSAPAALRNFSSSSHNLLVCECDAAALHEELGLRKISTRSTE
jgi:hypothetical protein